MHGFASILLDGISYGSLLFIVSVGLSISLGLMNFINLAHGAFAMFGGYVCLIATVQAGFPFLGGLVAAFTATAAIGVLLERTFYRRLYKAGHLDQVLFTVGLALAAVSSATYFFGPRQLAIKVPTWLEGRVNVLGIDVSVYRIALIAIVLIIAMCLSAIMTRTRFGAQLRAAVDDPVAAAGSGINVGLVSATAFAAGSGLAGLGGALGVNVLALEPTYPLKYLVDFLLVAVLGGTGTLAGPLLAALLIGIVDVGGKYYLPGVGAFAIYAMMPVLVTAFPNGLMGRRA